MKDSRGFIAGVVLIAAAAASCVASTYRVFSQTVDEPIHIAAGFEWLETSKYEIDREHPPLARVLFALPAWFAGVKVDTTVGRVDQGNHIIDQNGLTSARAGNLLFFVLAMATVALWARRLFGNTMGLLALALFAALPPVLAHAGLATTDMAATAMTITSLFALSLWLDDGSWPRTILLGLAIALGMLSKFSFLVYFPVGALVLILSQRHALKKVRLVRAFSALAVAVAVVWAGYGFSFASLNELRLIAMPSHADEYIAAKYAKEPGYEWVRPDLVRRYYDYGKRVPGIDFVDWAKAAGYPSPLAGRSGRDTLIGAPPLPERRFKDAVLEPFRRAWHWVAVHVPLPAPMYLAGARLVQIHSRIGHPAFLFGERRDQGWWYYFPVVLFFKTPLPFLILSIIGIVIIVRKDRGSTALYPALAPVAMLAATLTSSINIGVRHVLPIYPFLSICAAYAAVAYWRGARRAIVALLLVWYFGSTVVAYPDYLAWFNAAAGPHPEQIALDSNLDWGQDLLRLTEVVREEKIDSLHLAYFGSADLQKHALPAHHLEQGKCVTGWVAISEHLLQFDGYKWLKSIKPARRVGRSIRLYSIPPGSSCDS